jgi:hypothetical protein
VKNEITEWLRPSGRRSNTEDNWTWQRFLWFVDEFAIQRNTGGWQDCSLPPNKGLVFLAQVSRHDID